jgi:hypothetical protein
MSAREGRVLGAARACGHRAAPDVAIAQLPKRTQAEKRNAFNAGRRQPGRELRTDVAIGDLAERSQTEKRNNFNAWARQAATRVERPKGRAAVLAEQSRFAAARDLAEQSRSAH